MKKPLGVSLISYFYIFSSIILLLTSVLFQDNANKISITARFGLSHISEQWVRVSVAVLSLIVIYGYINLKKWGFWLMILYSGIFTCISFVLAVKYSQQPFTGNMIWSIIVLLYTILVRKSFLKTQS